MTAVPYAPDQPAVRVDASLRQSLAALDEARQCAVLWFGEIMRRHLYGELSYASINQYATQALGFSRSRCGDFIQLARDRHRCQAPSDPPSLPPAAVPANLERLSSPARIPKETP